MKPKNFKEANKTYTKPVGWTNEQCSSLPTFQHINQDGHSEIISCWEISDEELEKLKTTKCIWFLMVSNVQTPILLSVDEPDMPFIELETLIPHFQIGDYIQDALGVTYTISDERHLRFVLEYAKEFKLLKRKL